MSRAVAMVVPTHLQERQRKASDPASSIWVSANAGSGKTHVLTQRVIRLLLADVPPAKILCLTFTKAAAAQMSSRVLEELSKWTRHDDAKLREAIRDTGALPASAHDLVRARRLFTRAVETPGGLKIQTIHAFCERLLHLFPFEANVPARFEVADDRRTEEMLALAKRATIAAAEGSPALALVADVAGSFGIDLLIADAMKLRAASRRVAPDAQAGLADRLGVDATATVESVQRAMVFEGLAPSLWPAIADVLETGLGTDCKYAAALREAAALLGSGSGAIGTLATVLDVYLKIFYDSKDALRARLVTKRLGEAHPDIRQELEAERDRLDALRKTLKAVETVERTQALVAIVDAVMTRYDHAKARQGLLDFDDLIERTLALLEHSDSGWVLHKLDAGIDHVLVDEAQDTSEAQWTILEKLTGDFAVGATARREDRSFFVVGDDKQSIFSFQGAAPLMFDAMRTSFERRFKAGQKKFERVELKTSFRSVPGVLDAVDTVFQSALHQDGLVPPGQAWPAHESIKARLPGLVEIWPALGATAREDPQDWSIPLDVLPEHDPVNVVADRVAQKIKRLTAKDSPDRIHDGRGDTQRPIRPGDILILVRTRGAFFEAVIRALKHHYIAVAGADRLDVANHIAVMDLVAAGRTALLPGDDLSLACLLKSPLFGLTDDDLITLAPSRRGPLFSALGASPEPVHKVAYQTIERWTQRAAATTPFAFYAELLGREGGRKRMEARLGPEAHDAIDEFLRLALAHEQQGPPSLGAFLADVEALESSIKRDMEGPGDAVRVMTVHAAKGLEAKIVFLPDTCSIPAPQLDPNVFDLDKETGRPPLIAWSPRKGDDPPIVQAARAAERKASLREYRRLLYVALTRAEERLYVAGYYNARKPPEDCWGAMIERAFPDAEEAEAFWGDGDVVRRIASPGSGGPLPLGVRIVAEQHDLGLPPEWLSRPVAAPAPTAHVRPSRVLRREERRERREALTYGTALHLLLQYLPEQPPERRAEAAATFLATQAGTIPLATHQVLVAEALATMADPALATLFEADAKAEVPVAGRLMRADGSAIDVRGTIDRLKVMDGHVIAADFKTGAPEDPPPRAYVEQMALYARVLRDLWPDEVLKMLLVWTRTRQIVELTAAELEAVAG